MKSSNLGLQDILKAVKHKSDNPNGPQELKQAKTNKEQ